MKEFREQQKAARLIQATGYPFPPPPVLGRSLGAADATVRLRPIFWWCGSLLEHDHFGKPASTFLDYALGANHQQRRQAHLERQISNDFASLASQPRPLAFVGTWRLAVGLELRPRLVALLTNPSGEVEGMTARVVI